MPADVRPTLLKLLTALGALDADYTEKRTAILSEMSALLRGDDGIGVKLGRLKAHWCLTWTERHKEKCDFDHKKHTAWLKSKLALYSEAAICAKMQSYVTNDEAYYVRARHPWGLFVTGFATWRGMPVDVAAEARGLDTVRQMRGDA